VLSQKLAIAAVVALTAALGLGRAFGASPPATLTASEIVKKTGERAQAIYAANRQSGYSYSKSSVSEQFDGKGKLREKKEKILQFEAGHGRLTQIKLNGRSLTGAEFRKQEQAAIEARQQLTDSRSNKREDNWEKYVTPELLAKYSFKLLGHEIINGRPAYMLAFEPGSGASRVEHFVDRLTNRLAGKVWIDEEDFEIARAEVALRGEVNLWGGMLGNLTKCNFTVERTRVDNSVWFSTMTDGDFEGRKLLEPTHIRTRSESKDFHKTSS
jgi:hypothetical protein